MEEAKYISYLAETFCLGAAFVPDDFLVDIFRRKPRNDQYLFALPKVHFIMEGNKCFHCEDFRDCWRVASEYLTVQTLRHSLLSLVETYQALTRHQPVEKRGLA